MPNRSLSSLLCLVLLLPQTVCTCAVASFACFDPTCGPSQAAPIRPQQETLDANSALSCTHKQRCCHDDEDGVSSKSNEDAAASLLADHRTPDPSHEHKRHQPDCPTNQVTGDRASPKPQVEIVETPSLQLLAILPDAVALEMKTLLRNPPLPINTGGPPLYVTHRALLI